MELKDLQPGMRVLRVYSNIIILENGENIPLQVSNTIVLNNKDNNFLINSPEFEVVILGSTIFSVVEKSKVLSFDNISTGMVLFYPYEESSYFIQNSGNEYIAYKKPANVFVSEPEPYNIIISTDKGQLICSYEGNGNIEIQNKIGNSEEEKILQVFATIFYQMMQNKEPNFGQLLRMLISRSEEKQLLEKPFVIDNVFLFELMEEFIENVKTGKKISSKNISRLFWNVYK